jgi:hypothetical protein
MISTSWSRLQRKIRPTGKRLRSLSRGKMMPHNPTPKKTTLARYSFGSGRAAETIRKNSGNERAKPSKLPMSLDELNEKLKLDDE